MALALTVMEDLEGRQADVDLAYFEADAEKELYIELPDGYRRSKDQIGELQKQCMASCMWGCSRGRNSALSSRPRNSRGPGRTPECPGGYDQEPWSSSSRFTSVIHCC